MVIYFIYVMLFASVQGEDDYNNPGKYIYYDAHYNDQIAQHYLPSERIPNKDYKIHKGYQIQHPSEHESSPILNKGQEPLLYGNPLLTALLLSTVLGIQPIKHEGFNHPDQVPVNPYITLLLSQYGRYLPVHALGTKGLYYYAASNNYHNNKPFGSYKVHEGTR